MFTIRPPQNEILFSSSTLSHALTSGSQNGFKISQLQRGQKGNLLMFNGMMIKTNNGTNKNNNKEEIKMNAIDMYDGLKYCQNQGASIKFIDTPVGIGAVIDGSRLPETPFVLEFAKNLRELGEQNPQKAALYTTFAKNCIENNKRPVKILKDDENTSYFLCSNGEVLTELGLPFKEEEKNEEKEEEDRISILITIAQEIANNCNLDTRNYIEDLIAGIERAKHNDDDIRKDALADALEGCLKAHQHSKELKLWTLIKEDEQSEKKEEEYYEEDEEETVFSSELELWTLKYISNRLQKSLTCTEMLKLEGIKDLLKEAKQGIPESIRELKAIREEVGDNWNF